MQVARDSLLLGAVILRNGTSLTRAVREKHIT